MPEHSGTIVRIAADAILTLHALWVVFLGGKCPAAAMQSALRLPGLLSHALPGGDLPRGGLARRPDLGRGAPVRDRALAVRPLW